MRVCEMEKTLPCSFWGINEKKEARRTSWSEEHGSQLMWNFPKKLCKLKLFHYNYYSTQDSLLQKTPLAMVTASYSRAVHIRFTPHYPHPFFGAPPHIFPTRKRSELSRKNYFMNFSYEIGFHAFLSFLLRMEKRSYRQQIHFSFISFIENEERGKSFSQQKMRPLGCPRSCQQITLEQMTKLLQNMIEKKN